MSLVASFRGRLRRMFLRRISVDLDEVNSRGPQNTKSESFNLASIPLTVPRELRPDTATAAVYLSETWSSQCLLKLGKQWSRT